MRAGSHVAFVFAVSVLAAGPLHAQTPSVTAPAAATGSKADSATVETKQGYARILFTFAAPAPVTATVADGVVTIRLGRPITANIDTLTESLGTYVSGGRRAGDGLTSPRAVGKPVSRRNFTSMNPPTIQLGPAHSQSVAPGASPPPAPPVPRQAV